MKVSDNMKKIVPFKKDIIFKTNLSEIVSISLEHSLHLEKNSLITGEFIVSGEYKMADTSIDTEKFSFNLPFDINIDDRYLLDNMTVDIDDFYYEIVNNNVLAVNIEVLIDKLEERPVEKVVVDVDPVEILTEPVALEENREEVIEEDRHDSAIEELPVIKDVETEQSRINIDTIFDDLNDDAETYTTYQVYIVREGDTLDLILQKYNINKEKLEQYNDLKELKIGDKLIIP